MKVGGQDFFAMLACVGDLLPHLALLVFTKADATRQAEIADAV